MTTQQSAHTGKADDVARAPWHELRGLADDLRAVAAKHSAMMQGGPTVTAAAAHLEAMAGYHESIVREAKLEAALTAANQQIEQLEGELSDWQTHAERQDQAAAASMRERCAAWHDAEALAAGARVKTARSEKERQYYDSLEDDHLQAAACLRAIPLIASPQGDDGGERTPGAPKITKPPQDVRDWVQGLPAFGTPEEHAASNALERGTIPADANGSLDLRTAEEVQAERLARKTTPNSDQPLTSAEDGAVLKGALNKGLDRSDPNLNGYLRGAAEAAAASMRERAIYAIGNNSNYDMRDDEMTEFGKARRSAFDWAIAQIQSLPLTDPATGGDGGEVIVPNLKPGNGSEAISAPEVTTPNSGQPLTSASDGEVVKGALNKGERPAGEKMFWARVRAYPIELSAIRERDADGKLGPITFRDEIDGDTTIEMSESRARLFVQFASKALDSKDGKPNATPDAAAIRAEAMEPSDIAAKVVADFYATEEQYRVDSRLRWLIIEAIRNDRRSLASAPGGGWNFDMESAPKDGTRVLLAHLDGLVFIAKWGRLPRHEPCWLNANDGHDDHGGHGTGAVAAWRPLPPPPVHAGEKEGG